MKAFISSLIRIFFLVVITVAGTYGVHYSFSYGPEKGMLYCGIVAIICTLILLIKNRFVGICYFFWVLLSVGAVVYSWYRPMTVSGLDLNRYLFGQDFYSSFFMGIIFCLIYGGFVFAFTGILGMIRGVIRAKNEIEVEEYYEEPSEYEDYDEEEEEEDEEEEPESESPALPEEHTDTEE